MTKPTTTIYQKIHAIMGEVGRIEKDKINETQKYRYLSEEAIKTAVQPLLVKHQLLILPIRQELARFDVPTGDKKQYVAHVSITWRIVDVESGDLIEITTLGSGADSTDKGLYKAITGALKYLLTVSLCVPTGDDPERDGGAATRSMPQRASVKGAKQQDPESAITESQRTRLYAIASSAGKTTAQAKAIIASFGYDSSKDILVRDYDAICQCIQGVE